MVTDDANADGLADVGVPRTGGMDWGFDNTFALELDWLGVRIDPVPVAAPGLLLVNEALAVELGLDSEWLRSPEGVAVLAGNAIAPGSMPFAQAYAGHQFGQFSPLLGDGRANLLGEVIDREGRRRDIALKGSGRTPFSRGGDGRAAVGPVLREYILGEAMHALGVPTTRALAAVTTGESVWREAGPLPGAVLTRVAASHLRVGMAELVRMRASDVQQVAFADYVRRRHHPEVVEGDWLGLLSAVVSAQARLIAQWMSLGFIHGVMNTDNMTLSGETIDYGPAAFLEAHDPAAVFSSIDTMGRYRFGAQPSIAQWDLARYAETLLPSLAPCPGADAELIEAATERIRLFDKAFRAEYLARMAAKLGLDHVVGLDAEVALGLVDELLELMGRERLDHTRTFRMLSKVLRESVASGGGWRDARSRADGTRADALGELVVDRGVWEAWRDRWLAALSGIPSATRPEEVATSMDAVNPAYIPRNHLVEEALAAAQLGDLAPTHALLDAVSQPFTERPGLERYAAPAPASFTDSYVTYCGT